MPRPIRYNATLLERIDLSESLAIFRVRPDKSAKQAPWFQAGQYVTLGLNNESNEELGPVRRPLSLASCPSQLDCLEFYIRYVQAPASPNPLTHLLWNLSPGDRLFARPAATGDFTIEKTVGQQDPKKRVFIAAGTGLAPFISILRDQQTQHGAQDLRRYRVLHGARFEGDLGYREELEGLVQSHGLQYHPCLSRPEPTWNGHHGRVESLFNAQHRDQSAQTLGIDGSNAIVWICGLMGTIGRCIEGLLPLGFVPAHRRLKEALEIDPDTPASLYYEQYDPDPPFDLSCAKQVQALRDLYALSK